jgi:hypothetical protein
MKVILTKNIILQRMKQLNLIEYNCNSIKLNCALEK